MWLPSSLSLLALTLLVAHQDPTGAEVVPGSQEGFGDCGAFFFYQGVAPEGFSGARVCQRYRQQPRFATLYSPGLKVPLYSAFRVSQEGMMEARAEEEGEEQEEEEERWLVEPQIDDPENGLAGMMPEAEITGSVNNLGTNQALAADYTDSGYEKGQLNPSSLHKDDHQAATYTLTNAFPMMPPLQDVWHWEVENLVSRGLAPHCGNGKDLYLISGAIPSSLKMKDKVAVPESLWLAACCDDGSEAWSVGFIKQAAAGNRLEDLSLEELEKKLSGEARLFKNNCGHDRQDPKKLAAVLQSVKEIQAEEPVLQQRKISPSHQTGHQTSTKKEESGSLKKVLCFIITPIFELLKFVFYLIGQIVRLILYLLGYLIHTIINAVYTFIKAITSVLVNIFVHLFQVIVNILNGIATNIYSVLMIIYRILCVPIQLIVDILSFPFYVLGAVPALLQDIASGIGGLLLLVINAITNFVKALNYVVSHLAKKIIPRMSSEL